MNQDIKHVSKSMSYVLRHRPDAIGIELDSNGWVDIDVLIEAFAQSGKRYTREVLDRVVAENDKQRFEYNADRTHIRARQGHSLQIDLGYQPAVPPDMLYHGTALHNLATIREKGLLKMNRHHVHFSTNRETMIAVAQRRGKPVLLNVDAKRMHADGFKFFVTGNNVWLIDAVPPQYLLLPTPQ